MFVHILTNCYVADSSKLWDEHRKSMSEDKLDSRQKLSDNESLTLSAFEVQNYALAGDFQHNYNFVLV